MKICQVALSCFLLMTVGLFAQKVPVVESGADWVDAETVVTWDDLSPEAWIFVEQFQQGEIPLDEALDFLENTPEGNALQDLVAQAMAADATRFADVLKNDKAGIDQGTLCKMGHAVYERWTHKNLAATMSLTNQVIALTALLSVCPSCPSRAEILRQLEAAQRRLAEHQARVARETPERRAAVNQQCYDYATTNNLDVAFYQGGRFVKTSGNRWEERKPDGRVFPFEQINKDQWTVYLRATDRNGFYINIDLWRKWITFRQPGRDWANLYRINRVSSTYDFVE
ncbi:hypothetical protein [Acanthopleuribacter pedis]|uniref:Uncharacterized protein n=1 Tax=Acanthopleuribacter pedis TaxID=442870 RepID=A0A8J7U4H0_9BACT|nr:hypothetical protein [Acanthopleuribacter pedis]MBO1319423.1 hypothetical protein [Acanthopleuribacter pedis]